MGFSTPSYGLSDLFARIDRGDLQLPDFQRDYSWDVDMIRSLLVTVLRGFPVGCFMALDTRNMPLRFRPRPIEGAPDTGNAPGMLLLDGQQRLTTLYHCLGGDGFVDTTDFRGRPVRRKFYVDVRRAVEGDLVPDSAVFAVGEDGQVRSHFAPEIPGGLPDQETALQQGCIPVSALLGDDAMNLLFDLVGQVSDDNRGPAKEFFNSVVYPLARYSIPMIRLERGTESTGIGSIFAQANSAGLQMDVFELLTAVFSAEDPDFSFAEDWAKTEKTLREYPALDGIGRNEFLTAVALLVSARKGRAGGHREDVLAMSLAEYREAAKVVRVTLRESAEFLLQRCILSLSQVPYTEQIIPLAVILALLADREGRALSNTKAWDRINRWFWSGVFGELYGSAAVRNRMARDVNEVTAWVAGETDEEPKTVRDATFHEDRLLSAQPGSPLHHGIYALFMGRGARDWRTGATFDRWSYDQMRPHFTRIFPAGEGVDDLRGESVVNRTPMSRRTQVIIENQTPPRYLPRVQSKSLMDDDEFDEVLATHEITPIYVLRGDFDAFFEDRRERIIGIIEYAMGKEIIRDGELLGRHAAAEGEGEEIADAATVAGAAEGAARRGGAHAKAEGDLDEAAEDSAVADAEAEDGSAGAEDTEAGSSEE